MLVKLGITEVLALVIVLAIIMSRVLVPESYYPVLLLYLAGYPAYLISSAQKELLNGTFAWNIPGIRPRYFRVQVFWLGITLLAFGILVSLVSTFVDGMFANWEAVHFVSYGCIAGILFILMSMVVFRFDFGFLFPSALLILILLLPLLSASADLNAFKALNNYGLFLGLLVFTVVALRQMMLQKSFHRSICGRLLLTLEIAYSPSKMVAYTTAKDLKPGAGSFTQRRGGKMMVALLERQARAKEGGNHSLSKVWAGMFLSVSTLPRNSWGFYLTFLFFPSWILFSGYLDGSSSLSLGRWFSGMSFLALAYLPGVLSYSLADQPLVLECRRTREKAGFQFAIWLGVVSLTLSSAVWLVLKFLESTLPLYSHDGREIPFLAPHPEAIFSAVFVLPVALVLVAKFNLGRGHMNMISLVTFYSFMAMTAIAREESNSELPVEVSLALLGLFVAGMVLFTIFWKKRCRHRDQ